MSKVSRRFNLLLILSVALSVFISSISITAYLLFSNEQDGHVKDQIQLKALSDHIRIFLDHAISVNYQLSINPEIKDTILNADENWEIRSETYRNLYDTESPLSDSSGYPLLGQVQNQYDFVELFFIQDHNGYQTARSYGDLGERENRWWFREMALNQDYRSFISHSYFSLTGAKPVASIFHPIWDQGQFIGIMGMNINFHKFQEIVESSLVLEDMYAIVTDTEGVVIAHPDSAILSEMFNLKTMKRSVLGPDVSELNGQGYLNHEEYNIDWPQEISEAVVKGIAGETGYYENVQFSGNAQNIYYAPLSLSGIVNKNTHYAVLLIHNRSSLLRTRNIIFFSILSFILVSIALLYFVFRNRFHKQIIHPLELLIDSMKSGDMDHFKEIKLDTDDEFCLLSQTYNELRRNLADANKNLKNKVDFLKESESGYRAFAEVGLALSTERNVNRLMELILDEAEKLTRADGGTLYLYNPEKNHLEFSILHNQSMGIRQGGVRGDPIGLPPVPLIRDGKPNTANVSSHAAVTGKVINISNVYETGESFDFSGVVEYDKLNNYRSESMLVIPMKNMSGDLIGVIQLINARSQDLCAVQPFSDFSEKLIISLASQAAVALTNVQLGKNLEELFNAFIRSIAAAIDEKSAYTGGHIRRVVILTMYIAAEVNRNQMGKYGPVLFNEEELEELRLAAWMHDIGKITTPENVMDKRTKLERMQDGIEIIEARYRMMGSMGCNEARQADWDELEEEFEFLKSCNSSSEYLSDENLKRLKEISGKSYTYKDQSYPYLTENELYNLSIRKGNLNPEERKQVEHHAQMTFQILEELPFPGHLSRVGDYASMHHEKLDGSGYPRGLKADQIPLQARIITLADIFEALTAMDRPYREPMKLSKALKIMKGMVSEGHLDEDLMDIFLRSGSLTRYATEELNPEQVDMDLPIPDDQD
ncbi:HD domain-containing protein [Oceanispirochaeta crateris]|uniref:HD domain-containing protein n=1 Tax=Oceanispirochaeta crateris TaxID=2518645 RepID=A0A5C1QJP6_9SPIO|nr:HD domain-containing phosphohydrolase [Oceanispirochaeta crateris]QEN08375.1 HD domain-containing protein [Oceanispirochaeta crateris]